MKDKQNLVIPCSDKYEIVAIDQLMYCEGSDKYTYIHVSDGRKILSSYYIGKYKTMLANYNFFVCHKSYIVNLAFVQSLNSSDMIIMSNGKEVPLARRRKVEFMEVIGS
jgi:two-component system LytT family response regulator